MGDLCLSSNKLYYTHDKQNRPFEALILDQKVFTGILTWLKNKNQGRELTFPGGLGLISYVFRHCLGCLQFPSIICFLLSM